MKVIATIFALLASLSVWGLTLVIDSPKLAADTPRHEALHGFFRQEWILTGELVQSQDLDSDLNIYDRDVHCYELKNRETVLKAFKKYLRKFKYKSSGSRFIVPMTKEGPAYIEFYQSCQNASTSKKGQYRKQILK